MRAVNRQNKNKNSQHMCMSFKACLKKACLPQLWTEKWELFCFELELKANKLTNRNVQAIRTSEYKSAY